MGSNQVTPFRKLLDERFGMFVHFGLYSAFEGFYKGKPVPSLGEWIMRNAEIPIAEYEAFGREHFCPSKDFAKNLVKHAKAAGIRFIVMTSKHHDGFCLFKSEVSDYTTYGFYGRDLCKELSDACREEGIQLGLYYSHALDWHEKNGAGNYVSYNGMYTHHRNYWDFPDDNIDFEQYLEEKCFPQVRELLTNYGDLKIIWFDYPHDITKEQSTRLRNLVKSIQPDCQINSRIAHGLNDYESLGDNALPVAPVPANIECLITLNDTWGYKRDDHNWKSPQDTTEILCKTLASDATLLLNVGPKADGSLTPETVEILEKMGEWTSRNQEAVYGRIYGNPLPMLFDWGNVSIKGKDLFLYVKDKTKEKIYIPGILSEVEKVTLLGSEIEVVYRMEGETLLVETGDTERMLPVYKVSFQEEPVFGTEIRECDNLLHLGVRWAGKVNKDALDEDMTPLFYVKDRCYFDTFGYGLCLNKDVQTCFWADESEVLCWDAYFETPGEYEATLVHALSFADLECTKEARGKFLLQLNGQRNRVNMEEEKERYRISKSDAQNVRISRDCGRFFVKQPGKYRICLMKDGTGDSFCITNIDFKKV